jgi:predicted nuclease with TOPRIM domain
LGSSIHREPNDRNVRQTTEDKLVEKETLERLEITNEQVNNALIQLLDLVRELKERVEELEKNYDRRNS